MRRKTRRVRLNDLLCEEVEVATQDEITKEVDLFYQEAVALVHETKNTRISHLQMAMGLGYNRAFRMMEAMESDGIVGPMKPSGVRDYIGGT